MSRKHFGTDGVRGVANLGLTPEFAFKLGRAAGLSLVEQGLPNRIVMGRDTRRSGPMLGAAMAAGFCSVGVDVSTLGVAPTGAISWVGRNGGFGMAVVISASHNPAPDNGIKLIGPTGAKVSDETELWIEAHLEHEPTDRLVGSSVGSLESKPDELSKWLDYLVGLVPERLENLTIVVDGSHGAAYQTGPEMLRRLGANVIEIGCLPDGMNINAKGGATKPGVIQAKTKELGADIGIAFDGDADRAVFSDSEGRLINGDRMMAMWCSHWNRAGELEPKAVVGTVMSNGGFEAFMNQQGITLERTSVGDKYVGLKLKEINGRIGGEQSGHIIFPQHGPTGCGLVTALELLRVIKRENRSAADFFGDFDNWPQALVNMVMPQKDGWDQEPKIIAAMEEARALLGERGRLNVRPSGTEPKLRVMVEADTYELRDQAKNLVVQSVIDAKNASVAKEVDLTHSLAD